MSTDTMPLSNAVENPKQAARTQSPPAETSTTTPTTPGERWFDRLAYGGFAGVATFLVSVIALHNMQHSDKKALFGLFNIKTSWKESWELAIKGLNKGLGITENAGEKIMQTFATGMGGNIMLLPILVMESFKRPIVSGLNHVFGSKDDVSQGDLSVKRSQPQTIGSILKGRAIAYTAVFVGLFGADSLLKLTKHISNENSPVLLRDMAEKGLGAINERSGNLFVRAYERINSKATESGRAFWNRIGQASAVDLVATATAASLLYLITRRAKKKNEKQTENAEIAPQSTKDQPITVESASQTPERIEQPETVVKKSFTDTVTSHASHRDALDHASAAAPTEHTR